MKNSRIFSPFQIKRYEIEACLIKKELKVVFQDEARFGRITNPRLCWAPDGIRPTVKKQIVREYTYVYGSFDPLNGDMDSLILPDMYADTMSIFLKEVSERYPEKLILMVMDGAPCHRSGDLKIPENIQLLELPPYSPELNPSENMWAEMREKWFGNCVFESMDGVVDKLVEALQALEKDPKSIKSITGWDWIISNISKSI